MRCAGRLMPPFLIVLFGCQTGQLAGTRWIVLDITAQESADQDRIESIESVCVEFKSGGAMRTVVRHKDGLIDVEDNERYQVSGDTLVIRHPDYERRMVFELSDDKMQVWAKDFEVTLKRLPSAVLDRPAMTRPESVQWMPELRRLQPPRFHRR